MTEFESHITISRPLSEVFDLLLDLENTRYFDPDVESVQRITVGAIRVGTTYRFRERIPPFGRYGPASATYTAIDPNERTVVDFQVGLVHGSGTFLFRQDGAGTRLTFRGVMRPPGPVRLLAPVLARQGQRTWQARLALIKTWMEAGSPRKALRAPRSGLTRR